jgi:hypothetical protein
VPCRLSFLLHTFLLTASAFPVPALRISAEDFGFLPPWVPFLSFAALLAADFAFAESADPFCGAGFDCVLDFEASLVLFEAFESPFGWFTIAAGQERWTLRGGANGKRS